MGDRNVLTDTVNFKKLAKELKARSHCALPGMTSQIVSIAYELEIGIWAKLLIEEFGEDDFRKNLSIHLAEACSGAEE